MEAQKSRLVVKAIHGRNHVQQLLEPFPRVLLILFTLRSATSWPVKKNASK